MTHFKSPAEQPQPASKTQTADLRLEHAPPRLLVSVRDAAEARLAMRCGVDWIDLKNPSAGALGAPEPATAQEVAKTIRSWPRRSVALGELANWNDCKGDSLAPVIKAGFPVAKFGLAGMAGHRGLDMALLAARDALGPSVELVPVIYGDHQQCNAPAPDEVLAAAVSIDASYLLLDTFHKQGKSLLDFVPLDEVKHLVAIAKEQGIRTVLAGSIRREHLASLLGIGAFAIGVRGAVCSSDRASKICPQLLAEWVELFELA